MSTKRAAWALMLTVACSSPRDAHGEASPSRVVGRWEPVDHTLGGISTVLDFRDDGTLTSSLCVVVDSDYVLDASGLRLVGKQSTATQRVEITADTMIVDGNTTKRRVGTAMPGAGPIVGVWKSELHPRTSYERYEASGQLQLRIPFPGETGRYRLDGDRLELALGGEEFAFTVRRRGDILVLETLGAERIREYALTSRWYPLTGDR